MCNEVVKVYKHSTSNKRFAENAFPVLLSTQWTAVYDAELQALLGLCSLCAFVSNRTDARSVCLAVCPVLFVLYLKARCCIDQSDMAYARNCVGDFLAYDKQCATLLKGRDVNKHLLLASLRSLVASRIMNT